MLPSLMTMEYMVQQQDQQRWSLARKVGNFWIPQAYPVILYNVLINSEKFNSFFMDGLRHSNLQLYFSQDLLTEYTSQKYVLNCLNSKLIIYKLSGKFPLWWCYSVSWRLFCSYIMYQLSHISPYPVWISVLCWTPIIPW